MRFRSQARKNRRSWLKPDVDAPKTPSMPSSYADVAHLLRRVGFGGTPTQIQALTALDWPQVVDRVLDPTGAPSPTSGVPSLPAPGTALDATQWGAAYRSMTWWWLERCRTSPAPVVEKMVLFWSGLLCSSLDVVPHKVMFDQNQLFRAHALGRIDTMLTQVSIHPAMLIYLDNRANVRTHPNENFARELMELFTLGVGNYSEVDVRESARAWTGHTMNKDTFRYEFRSDWHDHGNKTFMGVTRNWDGPQIISHILRGPKQRIAASFFVRKLWTFIAYPNPSAALVEVLIDAFIAGDMRVDRILRVMCNRPEFRSQTAKNGLVRSPVEYVVAAMKHAQTPCSAVSPQWMLKGMGQEPFLPPNVDGWGANRHWMSTAAAWAKANFAEAVANAAPKTVLADLDQMAADAAVSATLAAFDITEPTTTTRGAMRQYVDGTKSNRRWGLINLALLSPEFQLA